MCEESDGERVSQDVPDTGCCPRGRVTAYMVMRVADEHRSILIVESSPIVPRASEIVDAVADLPGAQRVVSSGEQSRNRSATKDHVVTTTRSNEAARDSEEISVPEVHQREGRGGQSFVHVDACV